jgi:hypothetical protein
MEHIVCEKCKSEYDLKAIDVTGWGLLSHETTCEVCGYVLKGCDNDHENILIMTKRGLVKSIKLAH